MGSALDHYPRPQACRAVKALELGGVKKADRRHGPPVACLGGGVRETRHLCSRGRRDRADASHLHEGDREEAPRVSSDAARHDIGHKRLTACGRSDRHEVHTNERPSCT